MQGRPPRKSDVMGSRAGTLSFHDCRLTAVQREWGWGYSSLQKGKNQRWRNQSSEQYPCQDAS